MTNEIRCSISIEDRAEGQPKHLTGTLMVYGEKARDRPEIFERDSLKWDPKGIVVNRMHQRSSPILRVVPVVLNGRVTIDQEIPDSTAGRDCVSEVRSGLLASLSIEFRSVRERFVGGVRHLAEAVLTGAAVCDAGAYESATVEARAKAEQQQEWDRWRLEVLT